MVAQPQNHKNNKNYHVLFPYKQKLKTNFSENLTHYICPHI
jgi:hypothetical protein